MIAELGNTVVEALDAAEPGDTVTLLKDCVYAGAGYSAITKAKNVAIIGGQDEKKIGGYTIKVDTSFIDLMDGTTFKNVTIVANGKGNLFQLSKSNGNDVTFKNCVFNVTGSNPDMSYMAASDYVGQMTFTRCMFGGIDDIGCGIVVEFGKMTDVVSELTVNGCKFDTSKPEEKAMLVVGDLQTNNFNTSGNTANSELLYPIIKDNKAYFGSDTKNCDVRIGNMFITNFNNALLNTEKDCQIELLRDCEYTGEPGTKMFKDEGITVNGNGFKLTIISYDVKMMNRTTFNMVEFVAVYAGSMFVIDPDNLIDVTFNNCVFHGDSLKNPITFVKAEGYTGNMSFTECYFKNTGGAIELDILVKAGAATNSDNTKLSVTDCIFREFEGEGSKNPVVFVGIAESDICSMSGNTRVNGALMVAVAENIEEKYSIMLANDTQTGVLIIKSNNEKLYCDSLATALYLAVPEDTVAILKDCTYSASEVGQYMTEREDVTITGEYATSAVKLTMQATDVKPRSGTVFKDIVFEASGTGNMFKISDMLVDVTFEGCTFTGGPQSGSMSFVSAEKYLGMMSFISCTFENEVNTIAGDIKVDVKSTASTSNTEIKVYHCIFGELKSGGYVVEITGMNQNGLFIMSGNMMDEMQLVPIAVSEGTVALKTADVGAAVIGNVYYTTVTDAFEAAKTGDEVRILKDSTITKIDGFLTANEGISVIGNGHTLTLSEDMNLKNDTVFEYVTFVSDNYAFDLIIDNKTSDFINVAFYSCVFKGNMEGGKPFMTAGKHAGYLLFSGCKFENPQGKNYCDISVTFGLTPLPTDTPGYYGDILYMHDCDFEYSDISDMAIPVRSGGKFVLDTYMLSDNTVNGNPVVPTIHKGEVVLLDAGDAEAMITQSGETYRLYCSKLNDALYYACGGQTVTVLKDCVYTHTIGGTMTVNDNVTITGGDKMRAITMDGSDVQLNDGTEFSLIKFIANGKDSADVSRLFLVLNGGEPLDLTFDRCVFCTAESSNDVAYLVAPNDYLGMMAITNCTFYNEAVVKGGIDVLMSSSAKSDDTLLSVVGCKFARGSGSTLDHPVYVSGEFFEAKSNIMDGEQMISSQYGTSTVLTTKSCCEARIGGTYYALLKDALAQAASGNTVTVLNNCIYAYTKGNTMTVNENVTVTGGDSNRTITFTESPVDLKNGTSFSNIHFATNGTSGMFSFSSTGANNVSFNKCKFTAGDTTSSYSIISLDDYVGKISFKDCDFDNTESALYYDIKAVFGQSASSSNTKLTVTGCTFNAGKDNLKLMPVIVTGEFYDMSGNKMGSEDLVVASYGTSIVLSTVTNCQAQIDQDYYVLFSDALNASTSGQTLTLLKDVESANPVIILAGVVFVIDDGTTLTMESTGSIKLNPGASLTGKLKFKGCEDSATFTNLRSVTDSVTVSHGSIIISGTIDATRNVIIDANGTIKLNGVTVTKTTGSLIITDTGGGSDIEINNLVIDTGASIDIKADVKMTGTGNINNGEINVTNGATMAIDTGVMLCNRSTMSINTSATLDVKGTIMTDTKGEIVNSGTINGKDNIDPNVEIIDMKVDQIRFNIVQFVYSDLRSGVDVTVMPDSNIVGTSVKEAVGASVKYVTADSNNVKLGTLLKQQTVDVDVKKIVYEGGNACFEVDLKTNNSDFAKIVSVWAEYTFQKTATKQMTGVSNLFKFDPTRKYLTASS